MPIVLGVGIGYLLTNIVRYVMNAIGYGLTTVTLIILNTTVIPVVNILRLQKVDRYVIPAIQILDK